MHYFTLGSLRIPPPESGICQAPMPIEIKIDDTDTEGFSTPAKEGLREAVEDYASSLIEEANRIEAVRNTGSGPPEITHGMVSDAVIVQRTGLGKRNNSYASKILRITAAILALIVGFMYDPQSLQQEWYIGIFVTLVAIAILAMTISILRE